MRLGLEPAQRLRLPRQKVNLPDGPVRWPEDVRSAIELWADIGSRRADSCAVTTLKQSANSRVYRLAGVGPDGGSIIARRRRSLVLAVERAVQDCLAEMLPVPIYAVVEDGEFTWEFSADAGNEHYDAGDPDHQDALADWLVELHAAVGSTRPLGLPDHGPERYLEHLRHARALMGMAASRADLRNGHRARLEACDRLLDTVGQGWGDIASVCGGWQPTLVHGDLQPKNILVRRARARTWVVPIDWELAGWGAPAPDLGTFLWAPRPTGRALVRYRDAKFGDGMPDGDVLRLGAVGLVLRLVAAMEWESYDLVPPWVEAPLLTIETYADQLALALQMCGVDVPCTFRR